MPRLIRFHGILISAPNLILTEVECGASFEAAVGKALDLGIAETDPSFDVDSCDATVKVSALATVLTLALAIAAVASAGVDYPLKPQDIQRQGIRDLSKGKVHAAKLMGRGYKPVLSGGSAVVGHAVHRPCLQQVARAHLGIYLRCARQQLGRGAVAGRPGQLTDRHRLAGLCQLSV